MEFKMNYKLLLNKIKMNSNLKYSFYLIISLLLINFIKSDNADDAIYNKTLGAKCSSNLECNSACCSSDKCSETSKCEKLVTIVYICEAALCFLFIVGFTIYLIIKLKKIKKDFADKAKTEEEPNKDKDN